MRRLRRRGNSGQRWLTFLQNHREAIVAFDFFTVPTVTFKLLYGFFVIEHGRWRILHCNVTRYPTADWVVQQLREALPEAGPYRYVLLDRDARARLWPHQPASLLVNFRFALADYRVHYPVRWVISST